MSAKPYGDEAVGVLIRVLRGERVSELEKETTFEWGEDTNSRIAATLNTLRTRLAAAEARAERAVGLLGDARKCVSLVNVNGYYDVWLARCYALLKEVSGG